MYFLILDRFTYSILRAIDVQNKLVRKESRLDKIFTPREVKSNRALVNVCLGKQWNPNPSSRSRPCVGRQPINVKIADCVNVWVDFNCHKIMYHYFLWLTGIYIIQSWNISYRKLFVFKFV